MTQPAYAKIYPFVGSNEAGNAEWRKLAGAWGDGIVNDGTGLSFMATPSATDRSIVVQIHELRMRGIHFEEIQSGGIDPTTSFTLSSPPTGQTRCDRIVARYDPSTPSISIIPVEGAPVASGTPQPAALLRNIGGTWDLALWQFTGGNVVASQLVKLDERTWIGPWYLVPTAAALTDQHAGAAIGSHAYTINDGHRWQRKMVSNTPTWVDEDDPGFLPFALAGGVGSLVAFDTAPLYGKLGGLVKMRGTVQRGAVGGVNPPLLTPSTSVDPILGTLPVGFRPNSIRRFPVVAFGGTTRIAGAKVGSDGTVSIYADGNQTIGAVALDSIEFFAEQ